jgi:hypothetical protein
MMHIITWLLFGYLIWTFNLVAQNPRPIVKEVTCDLKCPSLPNNYFVVKTREDVFCKDTSGKSVLFKTIEQAKVER